MVGSGPHQTSPHQAEFANVHQQDDFLNLECKRDREKGGFLGMIRKGLRN